MNAKRTAILVHNYALTQMEASVVNVGMDMLCALDIPQNASEMLKHAYQIARMEEDVKEADVNAHLDGLEGLVRWMSMSATNAAKSNVNNKIEDAIISVSIPKGATRASAKKVSG